MRFAPLQLSHDPARDDLRLFTPVVPFVQVWPELDDCLQERKAGAHTRLQVLSHCYRVYAEAGQWESAAEAGRVMIEVAPDRSVGFIQLAHALHRLNRTQQAWNVLRPVAAKYPQAWMIRYNLACYACQLHQLKEAMAWLLEAFAASQSTQVKSMAQKDADLEPLWKEIARIGLGSKDGSAGACASAQSRRSIRKWTRESWR